ncbi:MAG: hypothetical protein PHV32_05140, partial [Eubacteriales bacterium]|nr:hypothetical protein [Eubacteriales bacterium]
MGGYSDSKAAFLRDDCVKISFDALSLNKKSQEKKLIEVLVEEGAVTKESATSTGLLKESEYVIRKEGSVVYLPVELSPVRDKIMVPSAAIAKAFPKAYKVVCSRSIYDVEKTKNEIINQYNYALFTHDYGFFLSENPYAIELYVNEIQWKTQSILIYNLKQEIIGYYISSDNVTGDEIEVPIETDIFIDCMAVQKRSFETAAEYLKYCEEFDSSCIKTNKKYNPLPKSASFEIKLDELPEQMQACINAAKCFSYHEYTSCMVDRSLRWYAIFINDKEKFVMIDDFSKQEIKTVPLNIEKGSWNMIVLYDSSGYIRGYC